MCFSSSYELFSAYSGGCSQRSQRFKISADIRTKVLNREGRGEQPQSTQRLPDDHYRESVYVAATLRLAPFAGSGLTITGRR